MMRATRTPSGALLLGLSLLAGCALGTNQPRADAASPEAVDQQCSAAAWGVTAGLLCATLLPKKDRVRNALTCGVLASGLCYLTNTFRAQQVATEREVAERFRREHGSLPTQASVSSDANNDVTNREVAGGETVSETHNVTILRASASPSEVLQERVEVRDARTDEPLITGPREAINPGGGGGEYKIGFSLKVLPQMTDGDYRIVRTVYTGDTEILQVRGQVFTVAQTANAKASEAVTEYPVWYATNRRGVARDGTPKYFGSARSAQMSYGLALVDVPQRHRFGSTGPQWWQRLLRLDAGKLEIKSTTSLEEAAYLKSLTELLSKNDSGERRVLVYIHGFNTSFEDAVIQGAQLGYDLKVPGLTAVFSWPSAGDIKNYAADEASIEASEAALASYLQALTTSSGATQVDIIAHSMGNRGLIRALQRLSATPKSAGRIRFGQILLAAPDVDAGLFSDLAPLYPTFAERTTLYVSPTDKALMSSSWLHGMARAGFTPPVTVVDGIDTVEVRSDELVSLGHGYFADTQSMLSDMFELIRHNAAPPKRQRLFPKITGDGKRYWYAAQ